MLISLYLSLALSLVFSLRHKSIVHYTPIHKFNLYMSSVISTLPFNFLKLEKLLLIFFSLCLTLLHAFSLSYKYWPLPFQTHVNLTSISHHKSPLCPFLQHSTPSYPRLTTPLLSSPLLWPSSSHTTTFLSITYNTIPIITTLPFYPSPPTP